MNEQWRVAAANKDFRVKVVFHVQQANDTIGVSTLRFFESEIAALTGDADPAVSVWASHTVENLEAAKGALKQLLWSIGRSGDDGEQDV